MVSDAFFLTVIMIEVQTPTCSAFLRGMESIPYHYLCTNKENKREEEILDLVQDTDFLILARYMQVNQMISLVPNHINYVNIEREESRVLYSFIIEVQNTKSSNIIFSLLLCAP